MTNILYAGYGEIGVLGLSKIFSSKQFEPSNIFIIKDEFDKDFLMSSYCKKYNLNLISENSIEKLKLKNFDICISVHWRKKITDKILANCSRGGFNLHPSLLPKYAGCSSLAWAIINNEEFAGFTWHVLSDNFDKGEIILQESIKISSLDTAFSLWNKVNLNAIDKIQDVINIFMSNKSSFIKQDLSKRTYFPRGFPTFEEALKVNTYLDKETYERASFFPGK